MVACPAPIGNDDDAQLIEKSIQQALREAECVLNETIYKIFGDLIYILKINDEF